MVTTQPFNSQAVYQGELGRQIAPRLQLMKGVQTERVQQGLGRRSVFGHTCSDLHQRCFGSVAHGVMQR
jgi:hypothetical protein